MEDISWAQYTAKEKMGEGRWEVGGGRREKGGQNKYI
jgi:hypothetical protein